MIVKFSPSDPRESWRSVSLIKNDSVAHSNHEIWGFHDYEDVVQYHITTLRHNPEDHDQQIWKDAEWTGMNVCVIDMLREYEDFRENN